MTLSDHFLRNHVGPHGTFVARIEDICPEAYQDPTEDAKPQHDISSRWKCANGSERRAYENGAYENGAYENGANENGVNENGISRTTGPEDCRGTDPFPQGCSDATYSKSPYLAPAPKSPLRKTVLEINPPESGSSEPKRVFSSQFATLIEAVPLDQGTTNATGPDQATTPNLTGASLDRATRVESSRPGCTNPTPKRAVPDSSLFAPCQRPFDIMGRVQGFSEDSEFQPDIRPACNRPRMEWHPFLTVAALLAMTALTGASCALVLGLVWVIAELASLDPSQSILRFWVLMGICAFGSIVMFLTIVPFMAGKLR